MPNEIKKFPYTLSVDAEQSDNTRRKSISQSSTTALIWTISGIILVACGGSGGRGGNRIVEDSDAQLTGTIGLADPTPPDDLQGTYGTLTYDAETKTWTYTLDDRAQALAEGQEEEETFTFTDANGVADPKVVTITVVGVNDAPEVNEAVQTALGSTRVEVDQPFTAITPEDLENLFTDVDASDTLTLTVTGLPSGLSYAPDTGITGTPDTVGESTVTVVADDGNGGTVEATFMIVVLAQAVSPVSAGDDAGAVNEDGTLIATGSLEVRGATDTPPTIMLDGDGDGDDVRDGSVTGDYGTMAFDGTTWTYTLNNTLEAVQALSEGQTETETFTFTATDASVSLTVTITVTGANDAPILVDAGVATRSVTVGEAVTDITQTYLLGLFNDIDGDALTLTVTGLPSGLSYNSTDGIIGTPTASGVITVTIEADDGNGGTVEKTLEIAVGQIVNADASDPVTGTLGLSDPVLPSNPIGTYGTMTLANDTWTYTLNTATTRALKAGEEVTETFTFTNTGDQETEIVVITVVGVNDAPVVDTAIESQRVTVDLPVTAIDLSDLFSDVDGDTLTLTVTGLPSELTYDSDANAITGTPETVGTFTVTVVANDGNGGTVEATFMIVVSAQAVSPVSADDAAGAVNEDGTLIDTGSLEVIGAGSAPPTIMLEGDGGGTYGTMTFDGTTWTYTLDNTNGDVQALGVGDTLTEDFTFTATDSQSLTVTITINGANDAPTLVDAGAATLNATIGEAVTDITQAYLLGLFNDIDGDALTLTVTGLSSGLSHNSTDGITGTPTASGIITVTVVADDGNGGMVEKTLEITVGHVVNEDADPVTGMIGLADPTPPNNLQGMYGVLTFDAATDIWTYTLDDRAQALTEGQRETETFTFTDATAGSTEDVVITVVGANDAPEVDTPIERQSVRLDQPVTAIDLSGLFNDIDGDALTLTVTGLPSGLTYDSDANEITGRPDTEGEFTVTVVADDGNGGTGMTTFVVVVVGQIVINEDAADPVTGTISLIDPTDPGTLQGTYGMLEFVAATNTWTYTLDNTNAAVQALAGGQTETETFTFTDATDGSTEVVEIMVVGVNDAPEITAASPAVSVPDGDTSFGTNLSVVDVDDGDLAALTSASFELTGSAGATTTIVNKFEVVNLAQQWTLRLKSGESLVFADAATFIINVSVTDAGGLTDNVDISFTVAPPRVLVDTGNSDIVGAAFEGDLSTSGDLDPAGDVTLASTTPFTISTQGTYGTASIGDDGEWVYKLDNGNADVRALNSGDPLTDTFVVDVTADDGSTQAQTITITISGRTDALGGSGPDELGDANTSNHQAIFGGRGDDTLTGGSGDDLFVGGYGRDAIDLSAGGADTVVYRLNSSDADGAARAEDGQDRVREFTPGEDKLVIMDVNESPMTLAALFASLPAGVFQLGINEQDFVDEGAVIDFTLSDIELDAGARAFLFISLSSSGTIDGNPTSSPAGARLEIYFDRVTSEALNDMTVWDTITGGSNFSSAAIQELAQLNSLFGGFGRPGYDAALDDGGFISTIGPDDLPDSYFEIA